MKDNGITWIEGQRNSFFVEQLTARPLQFRLDTCHDTIVFVAPRLQHQRAARSSMVRVRQEDKDNGTLALGVEFTQNATVVNVVEVVKYTRMIRSELSDVIAIDAHTPNFK